MTDVESFAVPEPKADGFPQLPREGQHPSCGDPAEVDKANFR